MSRRIVVEIMILLMIIIVSVSVAWANQYPVVVVSTDSSGDFNAQTPGTVTGGIQEAINYCVNQARAGYGRNLFVKKGKYNIGDTINIPSTRDFMIDGGSGVLTWTGSPGKDMIVVDSAIDCHYLFQTLKYGGTAAAIRIKPQNLVPNSAFGGFIDSEINISSVEPVSTTCSGIAVALDPSVQAISKADFLFDAIAGYATGLDIPNSGNEVSNISITCRDLHTSVTNAKLLHIGGKGSQNTVKVTVAVDNGASGVNGVHVEGSNNYLVINSKGGFSAGNCLLFAGSAAFNQARLIVPADDTDPTTLATDNSSSSTNQMTWTSGVAGSIRTLSATTGTHTYMQKLFPATARVVGGSVSNVRLIRGGVTVEYGARPRELLLGVGDQLQTVSSSAPTIQIIPKQGG